MDLTGGPDTGGSLNRVLPDARSPEGPAALLAREARLLVQRLRVWTPARWAAATSSGTGRADLVHHLAQALADAAAELERGPVRLLPRFESDLALPDQLAVAADDLVRAGTTDLGHVAHLLAHRRDLLGEPVPPLLAARLAGAAYPCSAGLSSAHLHDQGR